MDSNTCIIATIAPEVTLKSFHVRKFIEKKLKENIKLLMKNNSIIIKKIENIGARYSIETNNDKKAFELLKNCFGIYFLSLAHKIKYNSLEEICQFSANYFCYDQGTFAVKAKSYSKDFSSKKIEECCGGAILDLKPKLKVNLSAPKNILYCIVNKKIAYFFLERIVGARGMPVGSQGTVALICSGKKDEKLGFLLMQNGCCVKSINKSIDSLNSWNSSILLKQISFADAKKLFFERRIGAFFTTFTDSKKLDELSKKVGVKVFSPLIIDSYKTPI
jgi:tRNA uracil 4-sulfurtransferase